MTQPSPYPARRGGSGLAVTSLVLGILGLLCCPGFLFGVGAVVTGLLARRDAPEGSGVGMATIGLVLGLVSIVIGAMAWILYAAGVTSFKLEYG
jgi:hypothetical protein